MKEKKTIKRIIVIILLYVIGLSSNVMALDEYLDSGTIVRYDKNITGSETHIVEKYKFSMNLSSYGVNNQTSVINVKLNDVPAKFEINSAGFVLVYKDLPQDGIGTLDIAESAKISIFIDIKIDNSVSKLAIPNNCMTSLVIDNNFNSSYGGCYNYTKRTYFPVRYLSNGGSGVEITETNKEESEVFNVLNNSYNPPLDKEFKEWNTMEDGTGIVYTSGDLVTMPSNSFKLYAIWKDKKTEVDKTEAENTDDREKNEMKKNDSNKQQQNLPKTGVNNILHNLLVFSISLISLYLLRLINKFHKLNNI